MLNLLFHSDCTPCLPGKFCDKAGLEKPTGDCAGGWYCIRGAWSAKPADVGVLGYCNSTNGTGCFCPNTTTGGVCQPGFYCPNGSREPQPCLRGNFVMMMMMVMMVMVVVVVM